jgi:YidC/Oxa1 family membrane protein insertase
MYELIARPLQFFYQLWPNYAGAISLLTLSIMVILLPLTLKGTRSMLAMQKLQPEMKKLQNKHRDDRQKLNEEMMKFYKENNINPMSGCLPLLLQTPVFWFLYRTLYQLLNRAPYGQDMGAAVARASSGQGGGVYERFGWFHPKHLDTASNLYKDLSHTGQMRSFGLNLADSATKAVGHGFTTALPFLVLVLGVTATSFYQQKQIAGRNPGAAQANPQQQMLMKIMPIFFAFISLTLPAGIVVYFFVSNVFRIGQQALITRTMYADDDAVVATTGRASDSSSTGSEGDAGPAKGFRARMKELSEAGALPQPTKASREAAKGKSAGTTKTTAKPAASGGGSSSATSTSTNGKSGSTNATSRTTSRPSRTAPQQANRSRNKKKRK